MLKKGWLNAVCVLSVCCPCLSGDVQRCWRWPGQRLFRIALHGSVLIESGRGPSSGGYTRDVVLSDQTMAERDRLLKSRVQRCEGMIFGEDMVKDGKGERLRTVHKKSQVIIVNMQIIVSRISWIA